MRKSEPKYQLPKVEQLKVQVTTLLYDPMDPADKAQAELQMSRLLSDGWMFLQVAPVIAGKIVHTFIKDPDDQEDDEPWRS